MAGLSASRLSPLVLVGCGVSSPTCPLHALVHAALHAVDHIHWPVSLTTPLDLLCMPPFAAGSQAQKRGYLSQSPAPCRASMPAILGFPLHPLSQGTLG